ncbi:MAG TPA: hypothetical protein VHS96_12790 [Bacteroidia bacterium]|nr:hypothetical protein [Bacteroidia bacterium]
MAITSKVDLINKFKNGAKPSEIEFADLIDSCYGTPYWGPNNGDENFSEPFIHTMVKKVGVGTVNPVAQMHVVGGLKLDNGSTVDEFVNSFAVQYPEKKVPTVNAVSEGISSATVDVSRLMAYATVTTSMGATKTVKGYQNIDEKVMNFGNKIYLNDNNIFSDTHFKALKNGLYKFDLNLCIRSFNVSGARLDLHLVRSSSGNATISSEIIWFETNGHSGSYVFINCSKILYLEQSNLVKVWISPNSTGSIVFEDGNFTNSMLVSRLAEVTI